MGITSALKIFVVKGMTVHPISVGVQSRIVAEKSTAVYVHCHGHVLNLVFVDTCFKNPITKNFLG